MRLLVLHTVLISAFCIANARADSVILNPIADTTIIEMMPDNNMGGHVFFNVGTTFNGDRNRGLLRFDVAAGIPAGAKIKSAEVVLEVVGIPVEPPAGANFRLHRMLRSWGEGNKTGVMGPGRGDTATEGEVTWNHRFATTNAWAEAGGLAGTDFSSLESGEQFMEPINNSSSSIGSSAQMIADVQMWLDDPGSNHGWLLKIEDEGVNTTARRFASREDLDYGPQLLVEFDSPPSLEVSRVGSELHLSFIAKADETYALQSTESLNEPSWTSVALISAAAEERTISLTNSIGGTSEFFRILVGE